MGKLRSIGDGDAVAGLLVIFVVGLTVRTVWRTLRRLVGRPSPPALEEVADVE